MDPRDLLRALMARGGMNPTRLAAELKRLGKIDVNIQSNLSRWLSNPNLEPTISTMQPVADYFGIDVRAFYDTRYTESALGLDFASTKPQTTPRVSVPSIPVVGEVKAGPDGFLDEFGYPTGHGDRTLERWSPDPHAYALRVRGDSMRPKYEPGDYIIVEPAHSTEPGNIVVVKLVDGRKMVKKLLYRRNGELTLGSINEDYRTVTLSDREVEGVQYVGGAVASDSSTVREP